MLCTQMRCAHQSFYFLLFFSWTHIHAFSLFHTKMIYLLFGLLHSLVHLFLIQPIYKSESVCESEKANGQRKQRVLNTFSNTTCRLHTLSQSFFFIFVLRCIRMCHRVSSKSTTHWYVWRSIQILLLYWFATNLFLFYPICLTIPIRRLSQLLSAIVGIVRHCPIHISITSFHSTFMRFAARSLCTNTVRSECAQQAHVWIYIQQHIGPL